MNKILKWLGIFLLVIFLLWNIVMIISAFSGCPPTYAVERIYSPGKPGPAPVAGVQHVTDQELVSYPYLKEAFKDGKSIMFPIGAVTDFIPGNLFGPKYATHRMPIWERDRFIETIGDFHGKIYEYNGTYLKFHQTIC